ncbi:anaerobic ribonucleoside-triphosphate reductase activating protein [Asticcacaulis sp.]|uniref:anaerobic ribonucleoside-triphosphate reductase activating protein n=1 Tax=Asticcacaulis sp. TaxID=1872648 RepID=UPI002C9A1125|nr:anaerobic ribonucleoside-triphosphate reductase activating protein [Asticcacaulis sp.]HTM82872.1 anaerobic ribonucleoside-triphosphate reductase activating protein [Asticcacaulis sp.]
MWRKLPITSLTPFTFQDYPEHTACILWFSGCNMACGYCHNPELVKGTLAKLPAETIQRFLASRRDRLEGVVLSGGECTLSPALPQLAQYLKGMGYKVKIDTNGTNPTLLAQLLNDGLVDFIALDFKAPQLKFEAITGMSRWADFLHSLRLVAAAPVGKELRTTIHADLLDRADIERMINLLQEVEFHGTFVLQNFRMGRTLGNLKTPSRRLDLAGLSGEGLDIRFRNF